MCGNFRREVADCDVRLLIMPWGRGRCSGQCRERAESPRCSITNARGSGSAPALHECNCEATTQFDPAELLRQLEELPRHFGRNHVCTYVCIPRLLPGVPAENQAPGFRASLCRNERHPDGGREPRPIVTSCRAISGAQRSETCRGNNEPTEPTTEPTWCTRTDTAFQCKDLKDNDRTLN